MRSSDVPFVRSPSLDCGGSHVGQCRVSGADGALPSLEIAPGKRSTPLACSRPGERAHAIEPTTVGAAPARARCARSKAFAEFLWSAFTVPERRSTGGLGNPDAEVGAPADRFR